MNTKLKNTLPENRALIILSLLTLIFGALTLLVGEMALPLIIGTLGALYFFDGSKYKMFSVAVSAILLIINGVDLLVLKNISLSAPSAIILAFILAFSFRRQENKADTSYLMIIISALFSLISCILIAMVAQGEYTLEAVKLFYTDLFDSLRLIFVDSFKLIYEAAGVEYSEEIILAVFDTQLKLITAYFIIGGFITVGLGMKVFSLSVSLLAENKKEISEWRFTANSIMAYSYVILMIASMFLTSAEGALAVSVLNLYNVFLVIFAYIGFNFGLAILTTRIRRGMAILILIFILMTFSSFAISLLAMMGVMFTIRNNRMNSLKNS